MSARRLIIGLVTAGASFMGCAASHQSEELRKTQVAEEAALNADLMRGEK
jgi:hypothetical protein